MSKPSTAIKLAEQICSGMVELFHGSVRHTGRISWFTTDKAHAGYFGEVRSYQIGPLVAVAVSASDARIAEAKTQGVIEANELLDDYIGDLGADALVIEGWEGTGLCVYAPGAAFGAVEADEDDEDQLAWMND